MNRVHRETRSTSVISFNHTFVHGISKRMVRGACLLHTIPSELIHGRAHSIAYWTLSSIRTAIAHGLRFEAISLMLLNWIRIEHYLIIVGKASAAIYKGISCFHLTNRLRAGLYTKVNWCNYRVGICRLVARSFHPVRHVVLILKWIWPHCIDEVSLRSFTLHVRLRKLSLPVIIILRRRIDSRLILWSHWSWSRRVWRSCWTWHRILRSLVFRPQQVRFSEQSMPDWTLLCWPDGSPAESMLTGLPIICGIGGPFTCQKGKKIIFLPRFGASLRYSELWRFAYSALHYKCNLLFQRCRICPTAFKSFRYHGISR